MTGSWTQIGPVATATFLASLVEAVEALTIVLARRPAAEALR